MVLKNRAIPTLDYFYCRRMLLQDYLLAVNYENDVQLSTDDLIRADDNPHFVSLVRKTVVTAPCNVEIFPNNPSRIKNCSQSEIIHRVIEKMCLGGKPDMNIISIGFSICRINSGRGIVQHSVNIQNDHPNSIVNYLKLPQWQMLHCRIGDDVMFHLLSKLSVFVKMPQRCYVQIIGCPVTLVDPKRKRACCTIDSNIDNLFLNAKRRKHKRKYHCSPESKKRREAVSHVVDIQVTGNRQKCQALLACRSKDISENCKDSENGEQAQKTENGADVNNGDLQSKFSAQNEVTDHHAQMEEIECVSCTKKRKYPAMEVRKANEGVVAKKIKLSSPDLVVSPELERNRPQSLIRRFRLFQKDIRITSQDKILEICDSHIKEVHDTRVSKCIVHTGDFAAISGLCVRENSEAKQTQKNVHVSENLIPAPSFSRQTSELEKPQNNEKIITSESLSMRVPQARQMGRNLQSNQTFVTSESGASPALEMTKSQNYFGVSQRVIISESHVEQGFKVKKPQNIVDRDRHAIRCQSRVSKGSSEVKSNIHFTGVKCNPSGMYFNRTKIFYSSSLREGLRKHHVLNNLPVSNKGAKCLIHYIFKLEKKKFNHTLNVLTNENASIVSRSVVRRKSERVVKRTTSSTGSGTLPNNLRNFVSLFKRLLKNWKSLKMRRLLKLYCPTICRQNLRKYSVLKRTKSQMKFKVNMCKTPRSFEEWSLKDKLKYKIAVQSFTPQRKVSLQVYEFLQIMYVVEPSLFLM